MKSEADTLVRHVVQRIGEMRTGIVEDMVDDIGTAKWATETEHYTATVEFVRKAGSTTKRLDALEAAVGALADAVRSTQR